MNPTLKTYEENIDSFKNKYDNSREFSDSWRDEFLTLLPGEYVADLGSGSGSHALYIQEKGFDVTCFDLSDKFLQICKDRGLKTKKIDSSYNLGDSFDGVWASASLLHASPSEFKIAVQQVHSALSKNSVFALALKDGNGSETIDGRTFYYYTLNDVDKLLDALFVKQSEYFVKKEKQNWNFSLWIKKP